MKVRDVCINQSPSDCCQPSEKQLQFVGSATDAVQLCLVSSRLVQQPVSEDKTQ